MKKLYFFLSLSIYLTLLPMSFATMLPVSEYEKAINCRPGNLMYTSYVCAGYNQDLFTFNHQRDNRVWFDPNQLLSQKALVSPGWPELTPYTPDPYAELRAIEMMRLNDMSRYYNPKIDQRYSVPSYEFLTGRQNGAFIIR